MGERMTADYQSTGAIGQEEGASVIPMASSFGKDVAADLMEIAASWRQNPSFSIFLANARVGAEDKDGNGARPSHRTLLLVTRPFEEQHEEVAFRLRMELRCVDGLPRGS
jgi:hypothetical protein